ncbi:MAG: hypothetical protein CME63_05395 [Halobacteriovoraceae bacterium]|nr:hypothetical protein [Halobacteriovoraceae bacterium]|tara:strand:+ start:123194 stop:124819 length:1626 start_codon:yes stop_codon:yes gene_type:complete
MRLYIILIFTAVAMAFSTGYIALFLQGTYQATPSDILKIDQVKQDFQREVEPRYIINFNSLYFSENQFQLLDPRFTFNQRNVFKEDNRFGTSKNCDVPFSDLLNQNNFNKVWIWEEFRCGRRANLPREFFIQDPFIHPSGQSFAYLAFRLGKNDYDSRAWVMAHLPFFHVSELKKLKREYGQLRGIFEILEGVGEQALNDLIRGKGTILTSEYLFARLTYPKIFNILEYRIYARNDLESFLKDNSPYILHNYKRGRSCFYRDGGICWDYNIKHIFKLANDSTIILFFGLIIIILVVVRMLLVKLKAQRLEDEQRRLALRVLTHEFRTPITSLTLLLEKMSRKYESFDEDLEEVYLRMSSEVHRLRRLTETSRNYLKAQQNDKLLELNIEKVDSVNLFVEDIIAPFLDAHEGKVVFKPLPEDIALYQDTYWLGICMKNIVENAVTHGDFPVTITLMKQKNKLLFEVEDKGQCQFESLGIMTQEFIKGNKSSGTGLGMNIVKKVCREMNIDLNLKLNPTTFTMTIPINQSGQSKTFNARIKRG